jgi:hypothetical protein
MQLADIVNGKVAGRALTEQGKLIATYALCGFANFSSIAIQIGGIGGLAPERRGDLAQVRSARGARWFDRNLHDGDHRGRADAFQLISVP